MDSPYISVLMTCYNREKFLAESIESVIGSTYQNFELIIIDDNSTDDSLKIAKYYEAIHSKIKVFKNDSNLGDYKNRNFAVSKSDYDYFTFVDSDDLIFSHSLNVMAEAIIKFPGYGIYLMTRDNDKKNELIYPMMSYDAFWSHFFVDGFLATGPLGALFNKNVFIKLGGFSERKYTSDVDYFFRVTLNGPIVRLPSGLGFWRKHEHQESNVDFEYQLLDGFLIISNTVNSRDFPLKDYKYLILVKLYLEKLRDIAYRIYKVRNIKEMKYFFKIFKTNDFIN